MGQEIVYCSVCQTRLLEAEFEKRKALWIDHRACCKRCVPMMLEALPPEKKQLAAQELRLPPPSERKLLSPESPKKGTERISKPPTAAFAGPASVPPIVIVAGVAAVLVLGGLILSMSSSAPERRSGPHAASRGERLPEPPVVRPPSGEPPPVDPRMREEKTAARSLKKARDFFKAEPGSIDESLALYEEAVWDARGTSLLEEAKRELETLQKKQSDLLHAELTPLVDEAGGARRREQFGPAIEVLEKALPRHPWRDWSASLRRQIREIRGEAERSYEAVKEKAADAKRRGDDPAVAAEVQRVRTWGLQDLQDDLEQSLASIKAAPVLSAEAKAYRAAWEKALHATWSRGYADALRDLEAAIKPIKDPALQAEAAADLEAIRGAGRVAAEAQQILARTPVSQKLSLEVEDAAGNTVKVEGSVTRASAAGLDLKTDAGSVRVDVSDLTAAALVELFRGRPNRNPDADARPIQAFLLLEGEELPAEAAEPALARLLGVARLHAAASWREREGAARALYVQAEREFEDLETRFASAEKYAALLSNHADARVVLRRRAEIAARLETAKNAAKDYVFFPNEMRAGGLFQRVTHKKGEVAVTLQSDQSVLKDHYVELIFTALADLEYKGWALVGACCAETYAHSCQGTELTGPGISGEKMTAEPGSGLWIAGKLPTVLLKRLHSMHGGPKAPARWEWIPLPLPRYSSGGRKVYRILSGQQGFSVRAVVISATRSVPLSDSELKEGERARLALLQKPAPARDPSLVAHWKFDEGSGTVAADATGNGLSGTLRNGPTWSTGRIGGALAFNGTNQYVDVGSSPKLHFSGAYTVAAWVNLTDVGGDKYHYFLGDYTAKGDACSLALRAFKDGRGQFFWEYPAGVWTVVQTKAALPVGRWIHLAGSWDGTTRRIYLNGVLEGADATPQQRPPTMYSLSIGRCGAFDGLYTAGEIDDVRLYSRALADSEVLGLVRSAARK
jgi:hypothetical protein